MTKRFIVESVKIIDDCNEDKSRIAKVITDKEELYSYNDLYEICDLLNEQQATINKLQEEKEYWESKAMTLLLQVRRLTSRMTDKEVEEFKKELEDD